jgi:hypothetical protein
LRCWDKRLKGLPCVIDQATLFVDHDRRIRAHRQKLRLYTKKDNFIPGWIEGPSMTCIMLQNCVSQS